MKIYKEHIIIIVTVIILIISLFIYNKYIYKSNIGITVDNNKPEIKYDVAEVVS